MELKEFIKDSVLSIVEGIVEANEEIAKHGASIPASYQAISTGTAIQSSESLSIVPTTVEFLSFDVALTQTKGSSGGGSISVFLPFLEIGPKAEAKGELNKITENLARLQFKIPLTIPTK